MTKGSNVDEAPKWSVQLIVDPADVPTLSPHLRAALSRDVSSLVFGGGNLSEDDEPPWITIDVSAGSWHEARVLAQHQVGRIYESAGLRPRELPVAWVAPLAPGDESSLRFLSQAKELLNEELYDLAVVAAQIHLEVHVDTLVRRAVETDASPLAEAVMQERRWSLNHSSGRKLLEALLGLRLTDFARWQDYDSHITRRNRIIHGGHGVEPELARESVELVDELWHWLNAALIPGAQPPAPHEESAWPARSEQLWLFDWS